MSVVYLTHHNENIYDFGKDDVGYEAPRPMKYISVHSERVKQQMHQPYVTLAPDGTKLLSTYGKHKNRTMGCAHDGPNPPSQYLRKNQGSKFRRLHDHICPKSTALQAVPKVVDLAPIPPCKGYQEAIIQPRKSPNKYKEHTQQHATNSTKAHAPIICKYVNFIARNVQLAKHCTRPPKVPYYIDTHTGDRHRLIDSGLIPQYVCGKDFAKVPKYIEKHKRILRKYSEPCKKDQLTLENCEQYMKKHGIRLMSTEERNKIADGLRANYSEQMRIFQGLSFCVDTNMKKLRQAKMEINLRQLSKDIEFIENNATIYISDY